MNGPVEIDHLLPARSTRSVHRPRLLFLLHSSRMNTLHHDFYTMIFLSEEFYPIQTSNSAQSAVFVSSKTSVHALLLLRSMLVPGVVQRYHKETHRVYHRFRMLVLDQTPHCYREVIFDVEFG